MVARFPPPVVPLDVAGERLRERGYAVVDAASIATGRSQPRLLPYLPATFATLHVAYGSGYLAGLVRFRRLWRPQVR